MSPVICALKFDDDKIGVLIQAKQINATPRVLPFPKLLRNN